MSKTALIVEDDRELSFLYADIFKSNQWKTQIVHDGAHVMEEIRNHEPGVVLLDLHLPNVSGLELLDQIHADQASYAKIIVITANPNLAIRVKGKVEQVLLKPVSYEQLDALAKHLTL